MSGRSKRGRPKGPGPASSPGVCAPPASPLIPDNAEESYIMREEGRMKPTRDSSRSRSRSRPRGTPLQKTRVNAQSKLKSPIKPAHSGTCTDSCGRENSSSTFGEQTGNLMDPSPYGMLVDDTSHSFPQAEAFSLDKHTNNMEDSGAEKICAFCNCGSEVRMVQGKLQKYAPTTGFNPFKKAQSKPQLDDDLESSRDVELEPSEDVAVLAPVVHRRGPGRPPGRGRRKGHVVVGLPLTAKNTSLGVDKTMFGTVKEKDVNSVFEEDGSCWAHHCCASWSQGVCQTDSYDLVNVDKALFKAMTERCSHCNRYGASVNCSIPRCNKVYHYPCAASSGSFQDITKMMTMLCPDHLQDAVRLAGPEAECVLCGIAEDIPQMLFCTSCGRHYHGRCLDPPVEISSLIRMGWQCPDCKVCQGCRQPGDDNRMLVCDVCDKGYHIYCLDPPMTTIPKTGWKCMGCRRCADCGSNQPGGGPTSRWHRNYTVCDSCYQQRNKGLYCPLCGRAYRQFTDVAMMKCEICEKWIHAECDNIDMDKYRTITDKHLPYRCPTCKIKKESPLNEMNHESSLTLPINDRFEDVDSVYSHQSEEDKRTLTSAAIGCITPSPMDEGMPIFKDNDEDCLLFEDRFVSLGDEVMDQMPMLEPYTDKPILGKLPLDEEMEIVKPDVEIFGSSSGLSQSPTPVSYAHPLQPLPPVAKVSRSNTPTTPSRLSSFTPPLVTPPKSAGKRKLPGKMKGKSGSTPVKKKAKHGKPGRPPTKNKALVNSSPGKENLSGTANTAEVTAKEETETEGLHSTPVLFSAADEFLKTQDMCLCCGSFGRDAEGQLIVCSQCGQCYHPYCVGVKVNKVILSKGWRCLDCTLCEGCGKGSDEARLLLCDNCDISYHTYCLDPPLEHVPQGGWKCKWCVCCYDCNATNPGFNSEWMSNYTQCGPCASLTGCPACKIKYAKNDLMIKCIKCERWLHGSCDGLMREEELEMASESGYHCLFCRPKTNKPLIGFSGMLRSSPSSFSFLLSSGHSTLGPPSPRATALHHYHPQMSDSRSLDPNAKPLHPCQRMNNNGGVVETTLKTHFTGFGVPQFSPMDNVALTDSGVRQMNSLKISARVRKAKIKNKIKPKKFAPGQGSPQKKVGTFSPEREKPEDCLMAFPDVYSEGEFVTDLDKKSRVLPKVNRSRANAHRPGVGGFVAAGRGTGARKFVGRGGAHGLPWKRSIQRPLTAPRKYGSLKKTPSHQVSFNLPRSQQSSFLTQQQESVRSPQDNTSNDSWSTGQETEGLLEENYPDWLQEAFFGKNLLDSISKKKGRRNDGDAPSTPSEDGDKPPQEPFGEDSAQGERFPQHEQAPYPQSSSAQPAYPSRPAGHSLDSEQQYPRGPQVQGAPKPYSTRLHQSSSGQHHANLGLENQDSWHVSSADQLPTDALNLGEDIPNPDALYSSLDMFADDEMSGSQPQPQSQAPVYTHSQAQQHQPHAIQAPVPKSSQLHSQTAAQMSQAHVGQELPVTSSSSWSGTRVPRQQQNNVLDLLCSPTDTLPHVDGHEVEEIFAGLEIELNHRDTSVVAPGLSGRQDPFISGHPAQQVGNRVTSAESSMTHPPTYVPGQQTMGSYHQGAHTQSFTAGAIRPGQFEGAPQRAPQGYGEFIPSQENAPFPGGRPASQPMHGMEGFPSGAGMGAHQQQQYPFGHEGPPGMFPPIQDEFGLTEDLPKERRRPPSPRVDPQKQQQKWHDDEKLGVMATISPVLYANIEHPNLSAEFPEWTNRYRAIARLWRKLSVEQREPFRLRARDNRVKLKDQGKRLAAEAEKREKEKREQEKEQKKAEEQQQQEQLRQELDQQQQLQSQIHQQPAESDCSKQSCPAIPVPAQQMSVPTPPPPVPDYVNVCLPSSAPLTPSTPAIPASPATPMTPMTPAPVTPTTPTFPGKFPYGSSVAVPATRVTGTSASDGSSEKGGRGRKTGGKAAKSKEEKEREKELRKERLRVQQEKERQWKLLQQKRQLENQRQTQQHQQENIMMRQELRRTQQTKAKPLCEETKKKVSVKKSARRPSLPNTQQDGGTLRETNEADRENSTPEGAVLTVLQEGDASTQGNAETPRPDGIERNQRIVKQQTSEPISISSRETTSQPKEINNRNRPLSRTELDVDQLRVLQPPPNPMNNGTIRLGEDHLAHQQQSRSWPNWPEKTHEQVSQPSDAIWSQQQQNSIPHQQQQSHELGVPSQLVKESQPELIHQTSWHQKPQEQHGPPGQPWLGPTQQRESPFPDTTELQQTYATQELFQQQQQQQAWQQRQFELEQQQQHAVASSAPPVSQHGPFRHQNQGIAQETQHIPEQPPAIDNRGPFQLRQHSVDMEIPQEQRTEDAHLQQGQPLSHWQHDPASLPSQVGAQAMPQPEHQGPLQGFQHSDGQVPHAHSSNMSGGWPHPTQEEVLPQMPQPTSGPPPSQQQPLPLQHLPQSQAQHSVLPPQQSMQQMPVGMMRPQVSTPHSAPQVSAPPPPPPLPSQPAQVPIQQPVIPPLQNLPHDDPQQIELIQQQHREQLLRIQQQQQLYQLQVQQHQLLQQQQQGGVGSVQGAVLPVSAPPVQTPTHQTAQFARPRAPQFVSPKDMPEIESEEEHQERLRFLYKQRQAQKQQQLQTQVQQQLMHHQLVQGMVPGVVDPSNPQAMQQLTQIRPQFPELMQQQMMLEYQRRLAQRQGLGQQTIQYDKVVQEFQQRQGGQLSGQPGPVLDLPHQRFALRPPAPGIPPGLQQGQVALYGLDPSKQQQLYQMQLQQQQQLLLQQQQQQQQRKISSDQQSVSHPSSTPRKYDAESEKEVTGSTEMATKNSECTTLASKTHQEDLESKNANLQVNKARVEDEAESSQVSQVRDGSHSGISGVDAKKDHRIQDSSKCQEAQQLTEEEAAKLDVVESVSTATKELPSNQEEGTVVAVSHIKKSTVEQTEKKEEDSEKEKVSVVASEKPKHFDGGMDNSREKSGAETTELSRASEASASHHTGSSEEMLQQQTEVKDNIPGEKENRAEKKENEPEDALVEKTPENVATPVDLKKEKCAEEKKEDKPLIAPTQQIRAPQPPAGKSASQVMLPASQPQQQVVHQQLIGLGHQFSMMQQQQAIYMQQYQALQQQFQQSQGQNTVVGQSLVALQRQAQVLQQQMIQCWQQIQILQQQLQGGMMPVSSSNPQQQMLQQQLLLQMQQGAPGFPKDQVLQQQQGVPVNSECKPPIKSPNPQKVRKPRRSKSRDTPTPQASPLPGQGVPPDWLNQQPQAQKPQSKPRGRRPKKSQSQDLDPEMQVKQQLLQQQLLQQMEISHRLHQQQDPAVSRVMTPHQTSVPPQAPETSLPQPQQHVGPYQSFHESQQLAPGLQAPLQQAVPQHPPSDPQSQGMPTADTLPPRSQSYVQGVQTQDHLQDPRQGLPLGHPQRPQQGLLGNPQGFPHSHQHPPQGHLPGLPQAHPQGQPQEHPQGPIQCHPQGQLQGHAQSHPQNQLHEHHQGFPQGHMQNQPQGFPQVHQQVPVTSSDSFQHMFPTPDHYLKYMQQQVDQKPPLVQYIAHANNPFSDEFMEIQRQEKVTVPSKAKGAKSTKKRGSKKDTASKVPKTPSTPTTPTTPQTPSTPSQNLEIPSASPQLKGDIAQWQQSLESATLGNNNAGDVLIRSQEMDVAQSRVDQRQEQPIHGDGQSCEPPLSEKKVVDSGRIEVSVASKESLQQNKDHNSTNQSQLEQSTPKEPQTEDVNKDKVSSETRKVTAGGIDALQKLECMVADMASEEEACKEIESSLPSGELELDEENMLKTPPPEVDAEAGNFAPTSPKRKDPESQASSISLECHEQTLTSPPADSRVTTPTTEGFPSGDFGNSEQQVQVNNVIRSSGGFSVRSDIDEQNSEKSKSVVTNNAEQYRRTAKMDGESAWSSPEQRQMKSPFLDSGEVLNVAHEGSRLTRPVVSRDGGIDLNRESVPVASSKRPVVGGRSSETRPVITMEDVLSDQPIGTQLLPSQFQGIPLEAVRKKVSRSKDSKGPGRPKSSKTDSTVAANKKRKEEKKRLDKLNEETMQMEWKSLITAQDSKLEQDQLKKQIVDQRREEYERKRKEYEEQQRRKRELQKELRQQKMLLKEQQKKKKLLNLSRPKLHNPENVPVASISKVASELSGMIKSAATLSLCEPKLVLTHALMHPYGSSPLNGHCVLKGSLGKATIDGIVDVYAQYPTPEVEGALGQPPTPPSSLPPSPHSVNGKLMVNGDVSAQRRSELLNMVGRSYARVREVNRSGIEVPHKRSCYMEKPMETVPASIPSPPLSDNINPNAALEALVEPGTSSAAMMASGRSSLSSSLSPSPETVQYVASSSPESDAVNRPQTPRFSALNRDSHRESTDSPTFPPNTEANIKRENLNQYPDAYRTKSCELESRIMEMRLPHSAANVHSMQNSDVRQSSQDLLDADLDNINVTLTLSPTSEQQVSERVASVADLIGCSPPRPSDIVIEPSWKPSTSKGNSSTHRNRSILSGGSRASSNRDSYNKGPVPFSHFDVTRGDEKASQKKPDGPYCRHCDVLIIGIGVTRHPDERSNNCEQDSSKSLVEEKSAEEYKVDSVNVQAGDTRGDVFCSEACLKQYFSHVGSRSSSPLGGDKFVGSMLNSARSEGHSSAGLERLGDESLRGNSIAKGLPTTSLLKVRRDWKEDDDVNKALKRPREQRWRRWKEVDLARISSKHELSAMDVTELLAKHGVVIKPGDTEQDTRTCIMCGTAGDGETEGPARLLNSDADEWVHLNCALWSLEVYETLNGALMNVEAAVKRGILTSCCVCERKGATIVCTHVNTFTKTRCTNTFHFGCALKNDCIFFKDKTMLCHEHRPKDPGEHRLPSYAVFRKVFVYRNEIQQIASMLRHNQENSDKPRTLRVGSLVIKSLGQLLPYQLQTFHTRDAVYPVGFKSVRMYWSLRKVNKRCEYNCVVEEVDGKPSFTIRIQEEDTEELVFRGKSPTDAWIQVLQPILKLRKEAGLVNLFSQYITGEDLFGVTEPFVLRIIESMPGVDQMQGYNMRYGRSSIMELPLAINPTGCARSEPLLRTHFRSTRAHALRTASSSQSSSSTGRHAPRRQASSTSTFADDVTSLYTKQFVHSKASQYRKLKTEWRNNVFLGRSNIQGLGLFANRDLEPHSMVIEYIGHIIRNEVANKRERIYENAGRGVYMFRIDSDSVIDATVSGAPARYINHSCMPNCVAEVVTFEREQKIIIISNRKVEKGEELTYDYKFDFEDDDHKIPCLCGASNCRKWMN